MRQNNELPLAMREPSTEDIAIDSPPVSLAPFPDFHVYSQQGRVSPLTRQSGQPPNANFDPRPLTTENERPRSLVCAMSDSEGGCR